MSRLRQTPPDEATQRFRKRLYILIGVLLGIASVCTVLLLILQQGQA